MVGTGRQDGVAMRPDAALPALRSPPRWRALPFAGTGLKSGCCWEQPDYSTSDEKLDRRPNLIEPSSKR
jgi:hypothetical protein